jgi:hypothetical protein
MDDFAVRDRNRLIQVAFKALFINIGNSHFESSHLVQRLHKLRARKPSPP